MEPIFLLITTEKLFVDIRRAWESLGTMQQREAMKKFCSLLGTCSPELGPWMEAQQKEREEKERLRREEEERVKREAEEAAERERQRLLAEEMRRQAEEEERYCKFHAAMLFLFSFPQPSIVRPKVHVHVTFEWTKMPAQCENLIFRK